MAENSFSAIDIIKAKVLMDWSGFTKGASKVSQSANDIFKGISSVDQKMGDATNTLEEFGKSATQQKKGTEKLFHALSAGAKKAKSKMKDFIAFGVGAYGFKSLITTAFQFNQELLSYQNSFAGLSDSAGDASQAVGTMYSVFGKSAGTLATIQGAMTSLNQTGMQLGSEFENLSAYVTNLNVATKISTDTLAKFTGGMMQMWQISMKGTKEMVSSMIALQDTFGLTTNQIEQVMNTVIEAGNKLQGFAQDGEASMKALTKGIGQSVGAMRKLGVSFSTATEFMQGLMDPERINENLALFGRLGISYQETMQMMESSHGKEMFFDKLMMNLPKLSKQITALRNPMARLQFAKSLGLPLEIAQKMAGKTQDQIQQLLQDYKISAKAEEATKKKQAKMKAEAGRFEESLHMLKMNALKPIMDFVNKYMGRFWHFMSAYTKQINKVMDVVAKVLSKAVKLFVDPLIKLMEGGSIEDFMTSIATGIQKAVPFLVKTLIPIIKRGFILGWEVIKSLVPSLWKSGGIGKLAVVAGGITAISKVGKFIKGLRGERGSKHNPMYVTMANPMNLLGKLGGKFGGLFSKGSKLEGLGRAFTAGKFGGAEGVEKALARGGKTGLSKLADRGAGLLGRGASKFAGLGGVAAKALGPVTAAVIGGFTAMGNSGKYFNLQAKEQSRLTELRAKGVKNLTAKEKNEYDILNKKSKRKSTTGEKAASFGAGAMTLGIGPMIDDLFGTQITANIAKGLKTTGDEFADDMEEGFGANAYPMVLLANMSKNVIDNFVDTREVFGLKALNTEEKMQLKQYHAKIRLGEKLSDKEMAHMKKLEKRKSTGFFDTFSALVGKIGKMVAGVFGVNTTQAGIAYTMKIGLEKFKSMFVIGWNKIQIGFNLIPKGFKKFWYDLAAAFPDILKKKVFKMSEDEIKAMGKRAKSYDAMYNAANAVSKKGDLMSIEKLKEKRDILLSGGKEWAGVAGDVQDIINSKLKVGRLIEEGKKAVAREKERDRLEKINAKNLQRTADSTGAGAMYAKKALEQKQKANPSVDYLQFFMARQNISKMEFEIQ